MVTIETQELQTTFPRHVRCRVGTERKGEVEQTFSESLTAKPSSHTGPQTPVILTSTVRHTTLKGSSSSLRKTCPWNVMRTAVGVVLASAVVLEA